MSLWLFLTLAIGFGGGIGILRGARKDGQKNSWVILGHGPLTSTERTAVGLMFIVASLLLLAWLVLLALIQA